MPATSTTLLLRLLTMATHHIHKPTDAHTHTHPHFPTTISCITLASLGVESRHFLALYSPYAHGFDPLHPAGSSCFRRRVVDDTIPRPITFRHFSPLSALERANGNASASTMRFLPKLVTGGVDCGFRIESFDVIFLLFSFPFMMMRQR